MRMITRSNPARRGAAVPAYFLERAHFSSPISVLLRVEIAASLSPQEELVRERRGRTRYTTYKKASYVSLGDRRRVEHLTKMITWKKKNGLQKMLSLLGGVGGSRFGNDEWSQSGSLGRNRSCRTLGPTELDPGPARCGSACGIDDKWRFAM